MKEQMSKILLVPYESKRMGHAVMRLAEPVRDGVEG